MSSVWLSGWSKYMFLPFVFVLPLEGVAKISENPCMVGAGAMMGVALVKPDPLKSILLWGVALMEEKSFRVTLPDNALNVNWLAPAIYSIWGPCLISAGFDHWASMISIMSNCKTVNRGSEVWILARFYVIFERTTKSLTGSEYRFFEANGHGEGPLFIARLGVTTKSTTKFWLWQTYFKN